jgi:hypothetical protein
MITKLTYRCDPESLADITPEEFTDAFENELAATPRYRNAAVEVLFQSGPSGLVSVAGDEDCDPADHAEAVTGAARQAFEYCCTDAAARDD